MGFAQGVTTSSINGRVTDADGTPLIGAKIIAKHIPSGAVYGILTNDNAIFRIPNMKVGGPYEIKISYLGYEDFQREEVYLRLGQAFRINAEMNPEGVSTDEVLITSTRLDVFDGNRTGAETVVTERQINELPTVSRSLGDFTRLTPQSTSREGNDGFSLSFNGMNNRYNAIYIDGAINNDVFGLAGSGTNGGQTGVSPISVDAIEELQVSLAPFDVRVGGFAGAAVSAVTRSGTNDLEASVYGFYRDENFVRNDLDGALIDDFSAYTTGFRVGGPIIKDKLFFFVNAEIQRDETPLPFDPDDYIGDATTADLNALIDKLENEYGYDPGTYTENERFLNSEKVNVKLDWNINNNHKLSLRQGWVRAKNLEGVQSNTENIRFLNASEPICFQYLLNCPGTQLHHWIQ